MSGKRVKQMRKQVRKETKKMLRDDYAQFYLDIFSLGFWKRLRLCSKIIKPRRLSERFGWFATIVVIVGLLIIWQYWDIIITYSF